MNNEEKKILEEILNSIPEKFRVVEKGILDSEYKEYYEIDSQLEGFVIEEEILDEANKWEKHLDDKATKILLVRLSQLGGIESYRKLEQILSKMEKQEIKEFGYVCLMQSRMFLENHLSDEPIGMISTGLGGKGNKLRYNLVLKSGNEFSEDKLNELTEIINQVCSKRDSELESIENFKTYVRIMILVSIDEAIGYVVEDITNKCLFVDIEYMCTNVEILEEETIKKWMKGEKIY